MKDKTNQIVGGLVRESAFREGEYQKAQRVLEIIGMETFALPTTVSGENALRSYQCAFSGDARPRQFACSYENKEKARVQTASAGFIEGQGFIKGL